MARFIARDEREREIRWKFLRARNQARFWCQRWTITWEQFRDLMLQHPEHGGRTEDSINLSRIDRHPRVGWTIDNVEFTRRRDTHTGPLHRRLPDGTLIVRTSTKGRKETPRWKSRSQK